MSMNSSTPEIRQHWFEWAQLDLDRLYALLKLRSEVFVVEQNCVFLDIDGADPGAEHLLAETGDGALLGGLRVLPPDARRELPAIGRIVVAPGARGRGLGAAMTSAGIERCRRRWPQAAIHLAAQEHLLDFYGRLGFRPAGPRYLDDGIWHVDMRLLPPATP